MILRDESGDNCYRANRPTMATSHAIHWNPIYRPFTVAASGDAFVV
jgi:hypothetical protein